MTHCLVTFLGAQKQGQYPKARYDFPDGHSEDAAFLGFPLRDWLQADRLVVFGTAGSMWDHLFERQIEAGNESIALSKLMDATAEQSVEQYQLDEVESLLAQELDCDIGLRIIPTALEAAEQTALVKALADAAEDAKKLSVDVTHGYRHLPMLVVTAALYLRFIRPDLDIAGLWYGAFDPATKIAPVHNLAGLLETADWLAALQRHEWLGDYDGVAGLIKSEDPQLADELRIASFRESIHQAQQSRKNIRSARDRLEALALDGPIQLFKPVLLERMNWVDENSLYLRQRRQAVGALRRYDYLRAALFAYEAFITAQVSEHYSNADPNDHKTRDEARIAYEDKGRHQDSRKKKQAYELLLNLRNVLAHGNRAKTREAQGAIASPESLQAALRSCIDTLLPENEP